MVSLDCLLFHAMLMEYTCIDVGEKCMPKTQNLKYTHTCMFIYFPSNMMTSAGWNNSSTHYRYSIYI